MKQILKENKSWSEQYVMGNSKKKILLDIIIDVKYLKGKRTKRGCENLGFVVFGVNGLKERSARFTGEDLLLIVIPDEKCG